MFADVLMETGLLKRVILKHILDQKHHNLPLAKLFEPIYVKRGLCICEKYRPIKHFVILNFLTY